MYGPDGAALSGASVSTIPTTSVVLTATNGTATLTGVPTGSWLVTANMTGMQADGTSVSVVANGTTQATLRLSAGSEFALARIVGIPGAYQDLLPAGEKRLTTNYASQAATANQIKTNGLANVPVKQYVYLQIAAEDAGGNPITAQSWHISSDVGSAVKYLDSWDGTSVDGTTTPPTRLWTTNTADPTTKDVRFRPDVPGIYTITVTATSSAGSSTYHLNVYAGTYVGVAWCASCHANADVVGAGKDVYYEWTLTGHATKFEKTYSSYSWSSDYCVQCHTTGYDESTVSGFDDMARLSGWDPTASPPSNACTTSSGVTTCATVNSFITWAKYQMPWSTITSFIADPMTEPMQKVMNIQCESCHGPGSNHPTAASHMSWDPSICAQCHGQPAQWALSKHSYTVSPGEWASASCEPCHSGQGFVVAKVQNKPIVFPDQSFPGYPATVFEKGSIQGIGCATCHDPHLGTGTASSQLRLESTTFTAPMGFTVTAGESAACKTCHVDKRDTTYLASFLAGGQSRGPHPATQVDMLTGAGGAQFSGQTYSSSFHTTGASECITCHMYSTTYAPACSSASTTCPGTLQCNTTGGYCACASNADCSPAQACNHGKCTDQNYGGHTFNMSYTPAGSATTYDHLSACGQCHNITSWTSFDGHLLPDYASGDTTTSTPKVGVQTEITTLLNRLAADLNKAFGTTSVPESGYNTMSPKPTTAQLQAVWNYWFVVNDGSLGVHNTKYAVDLLCDSLKALDPTDTCARP